MDVSASHGRLSTTGKDFIARRHKLLIDGQWMDASSGKTFAVFDPSNGQQIAQVAEGTAADVDKAVKAARRAFEDGPWAKMKPTERGKLVWKLGDVLEAHADELAELEALDNGKPIRDARAVALPFGGEQLRSLGGGWPQGPAPSTSRAAASCCATWAAGRPRSPGKASRSPHPATGTLIQSASRSAWWARSSRGTSRC